VASIAPSVGSTTAMGLEDDANNFAMVLVCYIAHVYMHIISLVFQQHLLGPNWIEQT
jgi:hypothetical protein